MKKTALVTGLLLFVHDTGVLVQDTACFVAVPNICPAPAPLEKNIFFMYLKDGFQKPLPFLSLRVRFSAGRCSAQKIISHAG